MSAVQSQRRTERDTRLLFFIVASALTTLMIGLRYRVGGDWGTYQGMYNEIQLLSFTAAMNITDPGYGALNWLAGQFDLGVVFANLTCAILFTGGVARLAWRQPNPGLAMLVAVPYLIIVVAMGYTRQAAAIGIICFAIAYASERHLFRLVATIGIAAMFHKTAILLLPIVLLPIFRRNILSGIVGGIIFIILFLYLLQDSSDRLITNYVQSNYDSQGAFIRISMNLLAAGLFLYFRRGIEITSFQMSYWVTCSYLSFLSVAAVFLASASSGIDRISLYLIPLQMITYSRLPILLSSGRNQNISAFIFVVIYAFLVQFVWLNYADNSVSWVPYRVFLQSTDISIN